MKSHSPLVAKFKLAHNHEDFELKKLLFNILILLSRDTAFLAVCRLFVSTCINVCSSSTVHCSQLLSEGHALQALFSYVQPNDEALRAARKSTATRELPSPDDAESASNTASVPGFSSKNSSPAVADGKASRSSSSARALGLSARQTTSAEQAASEGIPLAAGVANPASFWSPSFFEELQLHALFALSHLAPRLLPDYFENRGGTRLLALLEWCLGTGEFSIQ